MSLNLTVTPENPYTAPQQAGSLVPSNGFAAHEYIRFVIGIVLWIILCAMLAAVPRFGRMFADFGIELPFTTAFYIAYWWLLLPLATVSATIAVLAPIVHRFAFQSRSLGLLWFMGLIVIPLMAIAVTVLALSHPYATIITGLS